MKETLFHGDLFAMRLTFLLFILLFPVAGWAGPIELVAGTSPDGRFYVTIEPSPEEYNQGGGTLQIRRKSDQAILSAIPWSQFSPVIGSESAAVLWEPGSRAFALTWRMSRHWTGSRIYVQNGAKWVEFIPANLFQRPSYPGGQWQNGGGEGGKGEFTAVKWFPKLTLKMCDADGAYRYVRNGDTGYAVAAPVTDVYFRVKENSAGPYLDVVAAVDRR